MYLEDLPRVVNREFGLMVSVKAWPEENTQNHRAVLLAESGLVAAKYVVHTYNLDEVIDESVASGESDQAVSGQRGAKVGDKFVTIRRFASLYSDFARKHLPISAATTYGYVLDILEDMRERHARGKSHGDIRPDNVEIRDENARLIDAGVRVRYEELDDYKRQYVAPELRGGEQSRGTREGDVFSFLILAQAMMRPHMGSVEIAQLEAQWLWMADAAAVADPSERPTADALADAFPRGRLSPMPKAIDTFLDGFNAARARLEGDAFEWAGGQLLLNNTIAASVKKSIDRAPETMLYMSEEVSRRILTLRTVDSHLSKAHNLPHDYRKGKRPHARVSFEYPPHIDDRWKNRIHIDFYGAGIGPDHDENLAPISDRPAAQRQKDEAYYRYLDLASEVRSTLIGEHAFVYTSDVTSMFRELGVDVEDVDVVALRRWGYILAVPDHDRWLYPVFQFDRETGLPSGLIKEAHDARWDGRRAAPDEWATLSFWGERAHALGGDAPRDLIWDRTATRSLKAYIATLRTSRTR